MFYDEELTTTDLEIIACKTHLKEKSYNRNNKNTLPQSRSAGMMGESPIESFV